MNKQEFLQKLAQTRDVYGWRLDGELVRCELPDGSEGMPVTAVTHWLTKQIYKPCEFCKAAKRIGLSVADAANIVSGSDDRRFPERREVLKALNLDRKHQETSMEWNKGFELAELRKSRQHWQEAALRHYQRGDLPHMEDCLECLRRVEGEITKREFGLKG